MLSLIIQLEHIFDIYKSFRNLCELSNDVVIIVALFFKSNTQLVILKIIGDLHLKLLKNFLKKIILN